MGKFEKSSDRQGRRMNQYEAVTGVDAAARAVMACYLLGKRHLSGEGREEIGEAIGRLYHAVGLERKRVSGGMEEPGGEANGEKRCGSQIGAGSGRGKRVVSGK